MFRQFHFFLWILLLSSIFCFTNTFADENDDPINIENIIAEGNFAFPTPDGAAYIQGDAPNIKSYQRLSSVTQTLRKCETSRKRVKTINSDAKLAGLSYRIGTIGT